MRRATILVLKDAVAHADIHAPDAILVLAVRADVEVLEEIAERVLSLVEKEAR